jgi:hypothetical protein
MQNPKNYPFLVMFRFSPHVKVDRRWTAGDLKKVLFKKRRKTPFSEILPKLKVEKPETPLEKISGKSAQIPKVSFGVFEVSLFRNAVHGNTSTEKKKCMSNSGFSIFGNFSICVKCPRISEIPEIPISPKSQGYLLHRAVSVKAGFFSNFSLQIRPGRFSRVP